MTQTILCDIGGTHARFARVRDGAPVDVEKYEAAAFAGFMDALNAYTQSCGIEKTGTLRIATAGYKDQGVWRFVNKNRWVIDPAALAASGWPVDIIMNDFEAATWALPDLPPEDQRVLKQKENQYDTYCLLGPGTGLGLGYLHHARAQKPFVQKTHGGHMPIAGLNDEHDKIIAQIRARQDKAVVFETILSGAGYHMLQELTDAPTAMRLFHEFLGLFAATAVVAGHAYGGVYLTGGVVQHLVDNGVFDLTAFDRGFCFNAVASVRRDLQNTPIIYITDPTPALRGLLACQKRI